MAIVMRDVSALYQWWNRIDETVSQALLDMGEDLTWETALTGIDIGSSMLGCGAFGCVYPTRTPHGTWVVKISLDPFEGPLTNLVVQDPALQLHPGVAYIPHIWQLPVTHDFEAMTEKGWMKVQYKIWVILREDIDPTPDKDVPSTLQLLMHNARLDAEAVNLTIDDIEHGEAEERDLTPYLDAFVRKLDGIDNFPQGKAVANFMALYWKRHGVALADVHAGNVGYRIHDTGAFGGHDHPENVPSDYFVCYDIGASKVMPGKAPVTLMENPGRIPVIR